MVQWYTGAGEQIHSTLSIYRDDSLSDRSVAEGPKRVGRIHRARHVEVDSRQGECRAPRVGPAKPTPIGSYCKPRCDRVEGGSASNNRECRGRTVSRRGTRREITRGQGAGAGISGVPDGRFVRPSRRSYKGRCGGLSATGLNHDVASATAAVTHTSSFLAPIKVRSRSAKRLASNGFLNVSLILDRSKLIGLPSSGNRAIRMVSAKSMFLRRF